ncbi:hypothetical protein HDU87_002662 [Geranomyces variabilis]|uniref:Uncharacterized protein n=1 Tax=Geranomyces variabilis TaxID=109894 RepID=A0AAD5TRK3_9FUNG|nr:hypothetical protein HDU87_002662 [Geranomyces variabilis]
MGKHKEKSDDKDKDRKRHKKDKKSKKDKKQRRRESSPGSGSADDDDDDNDHHAQWVEKQPPPAVAAATATAPIIPGPLAPPPPPPPSAPVPVRDDWMTAGGSSSDGFFDFTGGSMAAAAVTPRKTGRDTAREAEEKRKAAIRATRELNPHFVDGKHVPPPPPPPPVDKADAPKSEEASSARRYEFGDGGSNWRMMKLKRILEAAQEEGRDVEEIALERYGSMADFEDAKAERAFLDSRRSGRMRDEPARRRDDDRHRRDERPERDEFGRDLQYRPTVRRSTSFQKPEERTSEKRPPPEASEDLAVKKPRVEDRSLPRPSMSAKLPVVGGAPQLPVPNPSRGTDSDDDDSSARTPILSKNALNALNAKVVKAKLMGLPNAANLEKEYERERARAERGPAETIVLSGVDSRGRLLDVGSASSTTTPGTPSSGQRVKKPKVDLDTHDAKGNRLRYAAENDALGLNEMIMEEKMAGMHDFDSHTADRIAKDSLYVDTHDYKDENSDKLARMKNTSEDTKRKIAIGDHKKHESAVAKCSFCYHDGSKPKVPIIALGTKSYLSLPEVVDMVPGHCLIVPLDHVLTTLECDDATWDEIRNFQKCLLQMFAAINQGVIFLEQVINFKWQKHTVIECIPLPIEHWEDASAYYKEAILASDDEWTQHRKLIDTSKNGFRRSMVKEMPYFHVWFDPSRGYGHVIENQEEWKEWFGREVVASVLDLPPDRWRRPRRIDARLNAGRMKWFLERWKDYDWTRMLEGGSDD